MSKTPSWAVKVRRVAPRLVPAVVAAVLLGWLTHWSVWALLVGAVVVVSAVTPLPWWRHVPARSALTAPEAQFTGPGQFQVELVDAGPRSLETLKAVRETVVADFDTARDLVAGAPGVLVDGLSPDSATAVAERLQAAGAVVKVSSATAPAGA